MIFLHDSVNTKEFENDRKLQMLKKGVITPVQFINLIDKKDGYVLFGPAIVDKTKIKEFMIEWKNHHLNIDSVESKRLNSVKTKDIVNNFRKISEYYPEILQNVASYEEEIKIALCPKCTISHHITAIVNIIKKLRDEGDDRSLGDMKEFIDIMIDKYSGNNKMDEVDEPFDIEWIKPESINGIGNDIIEKLEYCFECVIKHIGRAKILYEESITGYPDHSEISFDELVKGNKALEELYLKYLDSCSQMDMGSSELVGDIVNLPHEYAVDIIDLANDIRTQRLLFQEDIKNVPEFDSLRIKVKRLELNVKKQLNLNK